MMIMVMVVVVVHMMMMMPLGKMSVGRQGVVLNRLQYSK